MPGSLRRPHWAAAIRERFATFAPQAAAEDRIPHQQDLVARISGLCDVLCVVLQGFDRGCAFEPCRRKP